MKYLFVMHSWFVDTNGFEYRVLDTNNKQDAVKRSEEIVKNHINRYNNCDYVLIELEHGEVLKKEFDHKLKRIPKILRWLFKAL